LPCSMYFRIDLLELIFPTSCRHICGGPGRWFHRREVALHSAGEAVKRQPNSHGGNAMRHTEPVQAPNAPSTAHPQHVEDHDRANAPDPQRRSWAIPCPGIGRPGVGGVGLLCRQHGAADHRRGPGAQQRGSAVARHRVPAHVRRRTAARRADRGPALRATRSADRPDGVHHRVAGQRVRVHRRGV